LLPAALLKSAYAGRVSLNCGGRVVIAAGHLKLDARRPVDSGRKKTGGFVERLDKLFIGHCFTFPFLAYRHSYRATVAAAR
jgi:hypothetical protein